MPPKKLSRKLDEVLGREASEEMSDWMDDVDRRNEELRQETRADIAEFRHAMQASFDAVLQEMRLGFARIDTRFAEMDTKFSTRFAEMDAKVDTGFANVDTRFAEMDAKIDTGFAKVDTRFADVSAKVDTRFGEMDAKVAREVAERNTELLKWAIGFWVTSLLTIAGTVVAVARLVH